MQSDRGSGVSTKLFLNLLIQFYLNNVTNRHQLTLHSMPSCPTTWISYLDYVYKYKKLQPIHHVNGDRAQTAKS